MNTFEIITNKIVEAIEKDNVLPWRKPWKRYEGVSALPKNLVTRKDYNGVNILLLAMQGYNSPYWLTYKQAAKLGGFVRKGEKGTPIVYWSIIEIKGESEKDARKKAFIKYSFVFNVEQCDGIPQPSLKEIKLSEIEKLDRCERLIEGYQDCPKIEEKEPEAFYSPILDRINMPMKESFKSAEDWYSVLYHEIGHSTGHQSRLNRKGISELNRFGSELYSNEELVAELTASFLCAEAGIENKTLNNSVAYLRGWLAALKGDARLIVQASAQAQKATDYILGHNVKSEDCNEE